MRIQLNFLLILLATVSFAGTKYTEHCSNREGEIREIRSIERQYFPAILENGRLLPDARILEGRPAAPADFDREMEPRGERTIRNDLLLHEGGVFVSRSYPGPNGSRCVVIASGGLTADLRNNPTNDQLEEASCAAWQHSRSETRNGASAAIPRHSGKPGKPSQEDPSRPPMIEQRQKNLDNH